MKKIILEHRHTNHQKIILLLFSIPFITNIISLLKNNIGIKDFLILLTYIACCILIIAIAFLKRGLIKQNSKLYIASFFLGKLFFKSQINISKKSKITVLNFRKSQKFAWFSIAKPDLATNFNSYEINLLNEKHTRRNIILDLKEKENVKPTVSFLTLNFDLEYEKYNPRFR